MSLDITLTEVKPCEVYSTNITHNLGKLAEALGIYQHLWRPEELNITHARQLILPLEAAIENLTFDKARYKTYDNPKNWGTVEDFIGFLEKLLEACKQHPNATISVWR